MSWLFISHFEEGSPILQCLLGIDVQLDGFVFIKPTFPFRRDGGDQRR